MNKNIKLLIESIFDDNADIFNSEQEYMDDMYNIISDNMGLPYYAKLKIVLFNELGKTQFTYLKFQKADPANKQYERYVGDNLSPLQKDRLSTLLRQHNWKYYPITPVFMVTRDKEQKVMRDIFGEWEKYLQHPYETINPTCYTQYSIQNCPDYIDIKKYPFLEDIYISPDNGLMLLKFLNTSQPFKVYTNYRGTLSYPYNYIYILTFTGQVNYQQNEDIVSKSANKKISANKITETANNKITRKFRKYIKYKGQINSYSIDKAPVKIEDDNIYVYIQASWLNTNNCKDVLKLSVQKCIQSIDQYPSNFIYKTKNGYLSITGNIDSSNTKFVQISLTDSGLQNFNDFNEKTVPNFIKYCKSYGLSGLLGDNIFLTDDDVPIHLGLIYNSFSSLRNIPHKLNHYCKQPIKEIIPRSYKNKDPMFLYQTKDGYLEIAGNHRTDGERGFVITVNLTDAGLEDFRSKYPG